MLNFFAQLNYLRSVQRNFDSGGQADLLGVFTKILIFVLPVVVLMALWHYRHFIGFFFMRAFARLTSPRSRKIVENYLVSKGIMLEIFMYSGNGVGRKLANARVTTVESGKMQLELIKVSPTGVKLKGQRVICFTKPFAYKGKKINAFNTFVADSLQRGSVVKELSLRTPYRYRFVIRRKHERQKIAKEGAVRVKAWDGRKRKNFWLSKPDLQTINDPARYGRKMRLSVENISAGGMRMFVVRPQGTIPPLSKGAQLVLRVSIWNPQTRKFTYFNVIGTIRSRFKGKGGSIGLGIQFTAEGEKLGSGFKWTGLDGEMKSLVDFFEKIKQ